MEFSSGRAAERLNSHVHAFANPLEFTLQRVRLSWKAQRMFTRARLETGAVPTMDRYSTVFRSTPIGSISVSIMSPG